MVDDLSAYITIFFCKKKYLRVAQLRKKTKGILQNNIFMVYLYKSLIKMKRITKEKI